MAKKQKNIESAVPIRRWPNGAPKFTIFAPQVQKELSNPTNNSFGRHTENFTIDPDPWSMQRPLQARDTREYFHESIGYNSDLTTKPSWFERSLFYHRQPRR